MDQPIADTLYVSRRSAVHPEEAGPLLDHLLDDKVHQTMSSRCAVEIGQARVVLQPESGISSHPDGKGEHRIRRVPGYLYSHKWRLAPVTLELTKWSVDQSEIGLRLEARTPPHLPGWRKHYFAACLAVADHLATQLHDLSIRT